MNETVTSAEIVDGAIVNADVSSSAAIAFSKMADLTASRLLVSDGNGDVSVSDVTSAEALLLDGGTSATSTTLAAADRLIVNDNGTIVQVALSDFETFFEGAIDTLSSAMTFSSTVTVGSDGSGQDVIFYSGTSGDNLTWDASEEKLTITGTNGQTALDVADGNLVVADNIDLEGDIDVNGTTNLDVVDIDGAVNMAADLTSTADVIIDSDTKGLVLGDDQDVTLYSDAAGKVNIVKGTDVTPGSSGDTEGWIELVVGDSAASSIKIVGGEGGGTGLYLYEDNGDDNDDHWAITTGSGSFKIDNYSTGSWVTDLAITSAGNVGIADSSPAAKLVVVGDSSIGSTTNGLYFGNASGVGYIQGTDTEGSAYNALGFKTSANYALYIDTSDNVGIGKTDPTIRLHIANDVDGQADLLRLQNDDEGASTAVRQIFSMPRTGGHQFYGGVIEVSKENGTWTGTPGTVDAQMKFSVVLSETTGLAMTIGSDKVIDGDFNDTSDISLKENIKELSTTIDKVNLLKPSSFNWRADAQRNDKNQIGFIAQEVEEQFEELVSAKTHEEKEIKSINTIGLVAVLTKAVQELSAKVTALENA